MVNGSGKVICMKGQCPHVGLKLFFFSLDLDVLAFAQFRQGNLQLLRGSLPKSVPLDFGLQKTFALYFYHQHYYPS